MIRPRPPSVRRLIDGPPRIASSRWRRGFLPALEGLETKRLLSITAIRQINATDVSPIEIVAVGSTAYFITRDADGGASIRKSDGTAAGTSVVQEFPPRSGLDVTPADLIAAGGSLFFVTSDSSDDTLLERLDLATLDETTVETSSSTPVGGAIGNLTATPTSLFFTSDAGTKFEALDLSSGTLTVLHTFDDFPTPSSGPSILAVGSHVFFSASDGVSATGDEPWTSDGTVGGTRLVADIDPGASSSSPSGFASLGGSAYFSAFDGGSENLYRVNADLASVTPIVGNLSLQTGLVASGSSLYFVDSSTTGTPSLYRTTGSPGPGIAVPLPTAEFGSAIGNLADFQGKLLATVTSPDGSSTVLTLTDGTVAGTTSLGSIVPGQGVSVGDPSPSLPVAVASGRAFFSAFDAQRGIELWSTNGTLAGTGPVADLDSGPAGSAPADLTAVGNRVFFSGHDGSHFDSLFVSDGTSNGTRLVADFGSTASLGAVDPSIIQDAPDSVVIGHTTYFAADDGDHGSEVWKTDGTSSGTSLAADVIPGPSGSNPSDFVAFGGNVYFLAQDPATGRHGLYRLDVSGGTLTPIVSPALADVSSAPVVYGNRLAFLESDYDTNGNITGTALRSTDGTATGTSTVATFDPAQGQQAGGPLVATSTFLYFQETDPNTGTELWRSDGTPSGTQITRDIAPGADSSSPRDVTAAGVVVYFVASDGQAGSELWKTDGSASGTVLVANVSPLPGVINLSDLTVAGGSLYFINDDGTDGPQLWKTALATGATGVVALLGTSPASLGPSDLTAVGSRLLFRFDDVASSPALYATDGSAAGTVIVNTASVSLSPIVTLGGSAFFAGSDGVNTEFFTSDGTASGTRVFSQVPQSMGLNPFLPIGQDAFGSLVVLGDDSTKGYEPFLVKDDSVSPVSYQSEATYSVSDGPRSLVSGDFYGDGRIDIAVLEGSTGIVDILRSRGDGSFSPPVAAFTSPGLVSLVAADFDGDGKADLAGIGSGTSVLVFHNLGSGNFSAPTTVFSATSVSDLATGDMNGDSVPDLVVTSDSSATVSMLLSDGKGGFSAPATSSVAGPAERVTLGDFDGNSTLDVVVSFLVAGSYEYELFSGDGKGHLSAPQTLLELGATPEIASGDITSGASADLVLVAADGLVLVQSVGTVALSDTFFGPSGVTTRPLVADLNHDGLADVVVANPGSPGVTAFLSQGDSTFLPGLNVATSVSPRLILAVKLDGDGRNDLVTADAAGGLLPTPGSVGVLLSGPIAPNAPPVIRPIPAQTFILGQPASFTVPASDPNLGQTVTYSLQGGNTSTVAIDPQSGVVTIQSLATDPPKSFNVVVQAADNAVLSLMNSLTVSVNLVAPPPVNHPPVLSPISNQTVVAGNLLTFAAQATDPDLGQILTYSTSAPDLLGASIDPASGVFTYTPASNVTGTFSITITATDNGTPALSDGVSVQVVVTAPLAGPNHEPTLSPIADQTVTAGSPLGFTAVATDPDAGQTLTYSLVAIGLVGASIDPASGHFSYTPSAGVTGSFSATITATDNGSPPLSDSVTFQVHVNAAVNHAPVLAAIPDAVIAQGSPLTFQASASDPDAGQILTFHLGADRPSGATIDPSTGLVSWTPGSSQTPGLVSFTVTASDNGSPVLSDSKIVHVTVLKASLPPSLTPIADRQVNEGSTLTLTAAGHDSDPSRSLTYTLTGAVPAGASIDPKTGVLTYRPTLGPADVLLTVQVTDDGTPPLSAVASFHVAVADVAPAVTTGADVALVAGRSIARSGSFTDPGADAWTATVDYGDGSGVQPLSLGSGGTFSLSHVYAVAGSFVTTVTVTDGAHVSGASSFHVTVSPPAVLSFTSAIAQASERGGSITLTVSRTGDPDGAASVAFTTFEGSARAGVDYVATSGTLTFLAGQASQTIVVPILDAGLFSGQKTFQVALSSPTGAILGVNSVVSSTILDDDPAPPRVTVMPTGSLTSTKRAGVTAIVLRLSGLAEQGSASSLGNYHLQSKVKRGKKTVIRNIVLKSVHYDPIAGTITLAPAKKLLITSSLTLLATGLIDSFGRPFGGPSGSTIAATVTKHSVSVNP